VRDCLYITWCSFFSFTLLNCLYLDPQVFVTFALQILSPILLGRVSKGSGGCLAAGRGQPTTFAQTHHMFYWIREQSQNVLLVSVGGLDPNRWHKVIHTLQALACLLAQFLSHTN